MQVHAATHAAGHGPGGTCLHPADGTRWALVDCNNFYASCERVFRPDLMGKPVVVLSNNDGCIIARSAEAKALGVEMGMPAFKARAFLRYHDVAVFSSNYALYGELSARVMRTLASVAGQVDVYSIDEAFVPLRGALAADPLAVGRSLRQRVLDWLGLYVSVGIAPTRTLAKLANRYAKKHASTGGVFDLGAPGVDVDALLGSTDVGDVWGVGRRHAAMLRERNIHTARDLRDADDGWIRRRMTVTGWRTVLELRGVPCQCPEDAPSPRRTVLVSRSFGTAVVGEEPLQQAVATFAVRAGEKLRREKLLAHGLTVHIRTSRHGDGPRRDVSVTMEMPYATNDSTLFVRAAQQGLAQLFRPGYRYAKAGVLLHGLEGASGRQGDLMALLDGSAEQRAARERLMAVADAINARYGRETLRHAAQGNKEESWHMLQKHRSPRYMSRWDELPLAMCK